MPESREFVPGVHAARAVAVAMVLAAHLVGLWTGLAEFRWTPWQLYLGGIDLLHVDHQAGGHAGLLLFFLVSGYIVSQAAEGEARRAFIVKRAARLLPAMIVAVALAIGVGELGRARGWPPVPGYDHDRAVSAHSLLEALGLGPTFGGAAALFVLWTISVEYYWYALLAVFLGWANKRPVTTTWLLMATVLVLHQLATRASFPVHLIPEHLSYVFVILIGRWIYLTTRGAAGPLVATVGSGGCVALFGLTQWEIVGADVWRGAHPRLMALAWATSGFVVLLASVRRRTWRPVGFVADISYGLYLFHVPVMFLVLPLVSPGGRAFPVGLVLTVTVLTVIAWLSLKFVEVPTRRRARRWLGRRQVVRPPVVADS